MYELRKGAMMLLTPNKDDLEMYEKAGWTLTCKDNSLIVKRPIEKKSKKIIPQEEKVEEKAED